MYGNVSVVEGATCFATKSFWCHTNKYPKWGLFSEQIKIFSILGETVSVMLD